MDMMSVAISPALRIGGSFYNHPSSPMMPVREDTPVGRTWIQKCHTEQGGGTHRRTATTWVCIIGKASMQVPPGSAEMHMSPTRGAPDVFPGCSHLSES